MATVFRDTVPWYDKALAAAVKAGIADEVTELARAYREGVRLLRYDDPMGYERVRVERNGVAAVISPDNVVIGFVHGEDRLRAERRRAGPRGTKGGRRGPRSLAELEAWLVEDGFLVTDVKGHRALLDSKGNRVATLPSSPSDHRSMANVISDIRRATGLELRR